MRDPFGDPDDPDDEHSPDGSREDGKSSEPHARHDEDACHGPPPSAPFKPNIHCPDCHSQRIGTRNHARKVGGAIGTAAGTTGAIAMALSGAETGAVIGVVAGPAGATCGAIAGAIIAGLFGGAWGCATGATFGEIVDANVLDNYRCLACRHTFSIRKG